MKTSKRINGRNRNRLRWNLRFAIVIGAAVLVILPLDLNGWLTELIKVVV